MEFSSEQDVDGESASELIRDTPPDTRRCLGVGVVTKNVVASAVEFARKTHAQIMLIASRRQVDLSALGAGYVERWTAADLAGYVASIDPDHTVKICRDHGGPWQNPREIFGAYSEERAMSSALASLKADVDAGFSVLHLDTSVTPSGSASHECAVERLVHLYERAFRYATETGRNITFEVGLEDQLAALADPVAFRFSLCHMLGLISERGLPPPTYVVTQTGTKVVETENIGPVAHVGRRQEVQENLEAITHICSSMGVTLKAHNCDYLDAGAWHVLRAGGVTSANVAPEYGVAETTRFLELLDEGGFSDMRDRFLQLAKDSGRWEKWMRRDSTANDVKRAEIAGHYLLSTPEVEAMRAQVADRLFGSVEALDRHLQDVVKSIIRQHARWFGLLSEATA